MTDKQADGTRICLPQEFTITEAEPAGPFAGAATREPGTTPDAAAATPESGKCRAVKSGRVELRCGLASGHDRPPGTWHEASFTDHQEISYDGAHHTVHLTEHVTWEPSDPAREAVRHLLGGRDADA